MIDARFGQLAPIRPRQIVAADLVEEHVHAHAFAGLAGQDLLELTSERVVVNDVELNDDVVLGGFHAGEHGRKRLAAVDEQRGVVVARERHLGQFFERGVFRVEVFIAHAKQVHLLFERTGNVVDLRVAGPPGFHVTLKLAAAERRVRGQSQRTETG